MTDIDLLERLADLFRAYDEAAGKVSDADALARFEALCQSQAPASQPWTPVTDYSFEARRTVEEPHAQRIIETFKPERVLDVGCGHGHLVRLLIGFGVPVVLGCDVRVKGHTFVHADIAADWEPDHGGAMMLDSLYAGERDLVICREVLEHLTIQQIRKAVTNLCRLSSRYVYVTTRFHPNPQHLLDVATSDDLDPTHITMLNSDFLRTLFVLEGFARRPDLETAMDWQHKGRVLVYERV